jgi:hypothetical protein
MNEKDNLKWLIMETVSTTIQEFSVKHQPLKGHQGYGEAGGTVWQQPTILCYQKIMGQLVLELHQKS